MKLAPYALSDTVEGRDFEESPHPYRSEFQRDRDRIIHTKAFRRLEKKTQVFAPNFSDHFRNRLTHTIEVSQITRTIAEALRLNADLAEVLALSHDIGHPPYSHEGEKVLDEIMQEFGSGFEHNLHALRIVEDFEEKYVGFRGLNLTFEVREGIVKHSRDYSSQDSPYVEIDRFYLHLRPPLEAQLIDLSDEIAYNTADLDDGYDSGLLSVDQVRDRVQIFRRYWDQVHDLYPSAEEKLKVSEVVRRMINRLATSLIHGTEEQLRSKRIGSVEEVRSCPERLVRLEERVAVWNRELKCFLRTELYEHEILKMAREDAQRQLRELFEFYMKEPAELPRSHRERIDELGPSRIICDYIAGMTDLFAQTKYREIGRRSF